MMMMMMMMMMVMTMMMMMMMMMFITTWSKFEDDAQLPTHRSYSKKEIRISLNYALGVSHKIVTHFKGRSMKYYANYASIFGGLNWYLCSLHRKSGNVCKLLPGCQINAKLAQFGRCRRALFNSISVEKMHICKNHKKVHNDMIYKQKSKLFHNF